MPEDWRCRTGHKPGQQQRDDDNIEHAADKFRGHAAGKTDRNKAGAGHKCACQAGKRRGRVGKSRRFIAAPPLFEFYDHHFDGDDRIVHQQSQSYDQRT